MSWADDDNLNMHASREAVIHLALEQRGAEEFREVWGGGYSPQKVKPVRDGDAVHVKALFVFNGPVGLVRCYWVEVDGRFKEAVDFDEPIPVSVRGDKIEVNYRLELDP